MNNMNNVTMGNYLAVMNRKTAVVMAVSDDYFRGIDDCTGNDFKKKSKEKRKKFLKKYNMTEFRRHWFNLYLICDNNPET